MPKDVLTFFRLSIRAIENAETANDVNVKVP